MALTLFAGNNKFFDDIELNKALVAEKSMRDYIKTNHKKLIDVMVDKNNLSEEDEKELINAISEWKKTGSY